MKPPMGYLTTEKAAEFLGLSTSYLSHGRISSYGPPYVKLSRRVLYSVEDLISWAEARRRRSTSELCDNHAA